ncbi:hypothetical protein FLK61_31390 [Paenalkalicoccus suaedae]|uniref:Outer membrane lipoprotein carrier protein LolA n=1 Tax=Paenalkalicoccus suaedae TaxID=2592382 RepID=A0A859FDQ4_9BACI|nr:hypothetical protein [Paenalkalicoccus suaedae]QKS71217.1 hypothetical protein FLK61_31390 [Paenalkalicoccus suaedae]
MNNIYQVSISLTVIIIITACGESESEETNNDNLNDAEEIATQFIRYVDDIEEYRYEFEINGEEKIHVVEYADLSADEVLWRSETDGSGSGTLYQAVSGETLLNYNDHYNLYNYNEVTQQVDDTPADLLATRDGLESLIADEESSLTHEGEEEINGVMAHKISSGETAYWISTETSMLLKTNGSNPDTITTILNFEELEPFDEGFFELDDVISDDAKEGDIGEAMLEEQISE